MPIGTNSPEQKPYSDDKFTEELSRLESDDIDDFERQTIQSGLEDNVSPNAYHRAKGSLGDVVDPHELISESLKMARSIDAGIRESIRDHLRTVIGVE